MLRRRTMLEDNKNYPTIYYTTTDGNKISEDVYGLSNIKDHIISHDKENDKWKIVLDNKLTTLLAFFYSTNITTISLHNFENINTISGDCLRQCVSLIECNISSNSFTNVESIGYGFLDGAGLLKQIDLSSFYNVKNIGDLFLRGCSSLETIDLSPLTNVVSIGSDFIRCNTGCKLKNLILPNNAFTNALNNNNSYLNPLQYITSLTLLGNIHKSLGDACATNTIKPDLKIYVPHELVEAYKERFPDLANRIYCILKEECTEHFYWPEVDYPAIMYVSSNTQPLSLNVDGEISREKIGNTYVHRFSNETITIPDNFLSNESNLERIKFNKVKHSSEIIPNYFGYYWTNCKEIDLSPFSECTTINIFFIYRLYCLEKLDLSPLSNCTQIRPSGGTFVQLYCQTNIDFSPLSKTVIDTTNYSKLALFLYNYLPTIDLINAFDISKIPQGYIFSANNFFYSCRILMNLHLNYLLFRRLQGCIRQNILNNSLLNIKRYLDEVGYDGEVHDPYIYIYGQFGENEEYPGLSTTFTSNYFSNYRFYVENSEYPKWIDHDNGYSKILYSMDYPEGILEWRGKYIDHVEDDQDLLIYFPDDWDIYSFFKPNCNYNVIIIINNKPIEFNLLYHNVNVGYGTAELWLDEDTENDGVMYFHDYDAYGTRLNISNKFVKEFTEITSISIRYMKQI